MFTTEWHESMVTNLCSQIMSIAYQVQNELKSKSHGISKMVNCVSFTRMQMASLNGFQ